MAESEANRWLRGGFEARKAKRTKLVREGIDAGEDEDFNRTLSRAMRRSQSRTRPIGRR